MILWDYENSSETLCITRIDKGVTYKVTKFVANKQELAFWLKHYMTVDIEVFKLCSQLDSDES